VDGDATVPVSRIREAARALLRPSLSDGAPAAHMSARLPSVAVVVTTCRSPAMVRRCLTSLFEGHHAPTEVVVVENRPGDSAVDVMLREDFADRSPQVHYVEEPAVGLSNARNAGLRHTTAEVVAFTDDDVVADARWVAQVANGFTRPGVACVTGMILPLSLETPAQMTFEQFAGFGKGFERRLHSLAHPPAEPLYPYTAGQIGSGANTALRRDVARAIGGFDPLLGTGTPSRGGEDLDLFVRLLLSGYSILYEPGAVVFHDHPPDAVSLRRHALHYGVGLTAMLTKHAVEGPGRRALARRIPAGIRYLRDPTSRKNEAKTAGYPRALDHLEHLGMVLGPAAYLHSRLRARSAAPPR